MRAMVTSLPLKMRLLMNIFSKIRRMVTQPEKVWATMHDPKYLSIPVRARDTNTRLRSCIREIGADHTKTEMMGNYRARF